MPRARSSRRRSARAFCQARWSEGVPAGCTLSATASATTPCHSALQPSPLPPRAAGLLFHALYPGGVFVGISLGVEAGVSAMIVSVQPLLVAAFAGLVLGERVAPRQWVGLALGLLGVTLILARKLGHGLGDALGTLACVVALLGMTAGTLYQKRRCADMDLRTGNIVQFAASGLATGLLALLFEDNRIVWSGEFVFALLWLVLVLSLGAISLLYVLIRRGAASRVSGLFFLVPPCTVMDHRAHRRSRSPRRCRQRTEPAALARRHPPSTRRRGSRKKAPLHPRQ
jgi:drug/metabolite transporter (DMT)-like permease